MDKYCPSNGSEGDWFETKFCHTCEHDRGFREKGIDAISCDILTRALALFIDDTGYPKEWTYDKDEKPTCTAYIPEKTPEQQVSDIHYKDRIELEDAG